MCHLLVAYGGEEVAAIEQTLAALASHRVPQGIAAYAWASSVEFEATDPRIGKMAPR